MRNHLKLNKFVIYTMIWNMYNIFELQYPTLKHICMNFAINDLVAITNEIKCCDIFIWK